MLIRLLRRQRGSTLVITVGMLLVLSIGATGVIEYSSASARSSNLGRAGHTAFVIAEAGLNQAASVLAESGTVATGSQSFEGGTVTWAGTQDTSDPDLWTITATSTVANPTGGSAIQRTVTRGFEVTYDPGWNAGNEAWNYLFAASDDDCAGTFKNSFETSSPVFITGGLCMDNSSAINGGPDTLVEVGQRVTLYNSSHIGSAAVAVENVSVGGGCGTASGGPWDTPCTGAAHDVWSDNFSDTPGSLVKPALDLNGWYTNSKPGPVNGCTTSTGTPPAFDNDYPTNTTPNRSLGTVDLFSNSYDCQVAGGGRIAYDTATDVLTVDGVIFFDADIKLDGGEHVVYSGEGVIYAAGKITIENDTWLCGIAACATAGWDPNTNMLSFVAGSSTDSESFVIKNTAKFQGAVYAENDFGQANASRIEGPIVADRLLFENSGYADKWVPLSGLTPGLPGAIGTEPVVTTVPGSWGG